MILRLLALLVKSPKTARTVPNVQRLTDLLIWTCRFGPYLELSYLNNIQNCEVLSFFPSSLFYHSYWPSSFSRALVFTFPVVFFCIWTVQKIVKTNQYTYVYRRIWWVFKNPISIPYRLNMLACAHCLQFFTW
jgi:hypothetical protein